MEQNENKNVETAEATQVSHEETRKKLKKQRVRQIVASLIGVAILAFGLWKIVCLFLDYSLPCRLRSCWLLPFRHGFPVADSA